MAELSSRLILSIQDLEMQLGVNRLPGYIREAEDNFLAMTARVVRHIADHPEIQAVFVSGPTSSGKTTFTERLAAGLRGLGRHAHRVSLDDYYNIREIDFDCDGRPDYESIGTIDTELAGQNIRQLLQNERVLLPEFNFQTRMREMRHESAAIQLSLGGIILVEGLHGLSPSIAGILPREKRIGVFLMPFGDIVTDKKLFRSEDFRLLRRIVRDQRHRGAHALATIDYWPMIAGSEKQYFDEYLSEADFFVNSILAYESLVIAPVAASDIQNALLQLAQGTIEPSVFMARTIPSKRFADLAQAVTRAEQLLHDLSRIPKIDPKIVPDHSILQEFIGEM